MNDSMTHSLRLVLKLEYATQVLKSDFLTHPDSKLWQKSIYCIYIVNSKLKGVLMYPPDKFPTTNALTNSLSGTQTSSVIQN